VFAFSVWATFFEMTLKHTRALSVARVALVEGSTLCVRMDPVPIATAYSAAARLQDT